jgi:hypothetical protein
MCLSRESAGSAEGAGRSFVAIPPQPAIGQDERVYVTVKLGVILNAR